MKLKINYTIMTLVTLLCTVYINQLQAQTPQPFVTTWEVADDGNTATTDDFSITIPTLNGFYSYTVDWGDGTPDTTTYTGYATHTYEAAGTYTVAISGDFPAIYFNNYSPEEGDNSLKIKTIKSWGTQRWRTLDHAFAGCQNLTTIEDGAGVPDLTIATDMSWAFSDATSFNGNISTWDVSNVTDMEGTFLFATGFNGDISNWNVSNVTSMRSTFSGATSFNGDLSNWNVSNVTDMLGTFGYATSFNQDLSTWDVSNVTDMAATFSRATSFNGNISTWDVSNVIGMWGTFSGATSFNGDLSNWNVSNVIGMSSTFYDATSFNGDLSNWNVSNVASMTSTFSGATSFNGDLSTWNVSNVRDMRHMFDGATSFSSENYDALLTEWAKLTLGQRRTFGAPPTTYCAGKAGRDILINTYSWNITGDMGLSCPVAPFVTTWRTETDNMTIELPIIEGAYDVDVNGDGDFDDAEDMTNVTGFHPITFLTSGKYTIGIRPNPINNPSKQLRISHYDEVNFNSIGTPQKLISIDKWGDIVWTSMEKAFRGCSNMTLADDAGVPDLTIVRSTGHMFKGASSFNGDLSKWNVSSVKRMSYMLDGASSFNGNVSTWNVSNVTETKYMFKDATRFNGNISNWNVSNVTNMKGTFFGATNFDGNISTWNVSNVQYMHVMFRNATSFNGNLSGWNVSNVRNMAYMFEGATSFNGNISTWDISNVTNMTDMLTNADGFSSENYDALLTGWSNLTPQSNVRFGAPPTTYCLGEAGREILTDTYNWDISGDMGLSCPVAPFVTTWDTRLRSRQISPGETPIESNPGENTIKLPIIEGVYYDVDLSYDGNFNADMTNQIGILTITFLTLGKHTIGIRPNPINNPTGRLQINHVQVISGINMVVGTPYKLISIDKWGGIVWTSMESAFRECSNMILADDAGVPDLTMVNNMGHMFRGASSFNGDLSKWNVSSVERMSYMLDGASNFNGNVSTWNVSSATETKHMFRNAIIFNGNISTWNVSNVKYMHFMFKGASSFNGNIKDWDVSNVQHMRYMFRDATNFTSDLSTWNVSNVTNMEKMFQSATSFNSNISTWDITKVANMNNMFFGATSFSPQNYDALLTGWSNLTPQNGVTFGAPPTTYCAGKAGKDILINTYGWNISGDRGLGCSDLALPIKVFLQGPYDTATNMMSDGLRAADIIPAESPYGDGAIVESSVFNDTTDLMDMENNEGQNNIVDWVEVSLHNPNDASIIISSTPALLQKDGDVVALDGSSNLQIQGIAGDYKVSINHRNHIPVITKFAQSLSTTNTAIDFTNDSDFVTGRSNAMAVVATGIYALFSGDVDGNGQVQASDYNAVLQDIGKGGYLTSDINMNGEIQVSDINLVFRTFGKGKQF